MVKHLKCLKKTEKCKSKSCEEIVECSQPDFSSHCYAMTQHNSGAPDSEPTILYAGCWGGGNECDPPRLLLQNIEDKIATETHHDKHYLEMLRNFNLSAELFDPHIQNKCIGYAKSPNDQSYMARNNQTFCCCRGMNCNQNLAFVDERNPFEVFATKMNPQRAPNIPKINDRIDWFISARDLTMVCMSGLVCLLFVSIVFGLFFCFKTKSKKRKNSPYFSSVYYSRANSLNDELANSNLGQLNHELNLIQNNDSYQLNNNNLDPISHLSDDANNFPLPNNHINTNSTAPNIQIMPNNDIVYQKSLNKKNQQTTQSQQIEVSETSSDKEPIPDILPQRLKASDILLLERIAQGQFSSVWRSRCHNSSEGENFPEYAIKIFADHQKTAWSNEKDIYNTMSSMNDNVLKFYGSDINEIKRSEAQPSFMGPSREYWLLTEYHHVGSLYDFLKHSTVSWPQMVSLVSSFFEGLAFLHSENSSVQKSFAIAHRDLKSKNILVKNDLNTCCIGDFGLALKLQSKNKLNSAEIRSKVGTKRYMSPELIEGAIAFTKETFLRIDVYASALVLWEILSRGNFYDETSEYKLPFQDEVGTNPSLDKMKEIVVDKCQRPVIKQSWLQNNHLTTLAQTIEECWDIDLDARISAECAAARIRKIHKTITS